MASFILSFSGVKRMALYMPATPSIPRPMYLSALRLDIFLLSSIVYQLNTYFSANARPFSEQKISIPEIIGFPAEVTIFTLICFNRMPEKRTTASSSMALPYPSFIQPFFT
jgi:hypothetical protein